MKLGLDKLGNYAGAFLVCCLCLSFIGADTDGCNSPPPVSTSGVQKVTVKVPLGSDGMTSEQHNIAGRYRVDNDPGATKYLYVISAFTGDVLIYSTVRGKVTSGGKRLTPTTVAIANYQGNGGQGFSVPNLGGIQVTNEVLQDDGTYGTSGDYLYWFDQNGNYHQQYASSCIIHVSDKPLHIKHAIIDMEATGEQQNDPAPPPPIKSKK